jgi:CheY-like chemotaxis protein
VRRRNLLLVRPRFGRCRTNKDRIIAAGPAYLHYRRRRVGSRGDSVPVTLPRAHTFASADEFLESPHVGEAACLIVDVQMPKTSGIELQRMLRAKGIATPIIFITAFPEERIRAKALDDVSSCMLSKPFDSRVLIECLANALGKTGA